MACLSETAEYKSQRCLFFGRGRIRAQSAWQQGSLAPINAISTPVEQLDLGTEFKASQAVSVFQDSIDKQERPQTSAG